VRIEISGKAFMEKDKWDLAQLETDVARYVAHQHNLCARGIDAAVRQATLADLRNALMAAEGHDRIWKISQLIALLQSKEKKAEG
jgi:hypothetical protein